MNETQRLEKLLAGDNGGSVTLPRRDAQELAQKLKVRGNPGAAGCSAPTSLASFRR